MHRRRGPTTGEVLFHVVRTVFMGAAIACLLSAVHRVAAALKLSARVEVLERMGDAFTDDEREEVVRRIRDRTLGGL